jgi:hypothetical protein
MFENFMVGIIGPMANHRLMEQVQKFTPVSAYEIRHGINCFFVNDQSSFIATKIPNKLFSTIVP